MTTTPIVLEASHVTCVVPGGETPNPLRRWPWSRIRKADGRDEAARSARNARSVRNAEPVQSAAGRTIFRDLSLTVRAGDIVDLVGPSGSGKSTLLTALALLNPQATAVMTLDGTASDAMSPERWRRLVAYLPQRPTLIGATVREAIALPFTLKVHQRNDSGAPIDDPAPDEATMRCTLDQVGCGDIELDRPPQDLSVGQQARVCMLRTLLTRPRVMLADEVDAGLDDENAGLVADILAYAARQGMAIIRVRHRPADGRATRMWRLADGTLTEMDALTAADSAGSADSEEALR